MRRFHTFAIAAALAVGVGACGSAVPEPTSADIDAGFITGMVHHHHDAVEMAELAEGHAKHEETKHLAHEIVEAQEKEIKQLENAYKGIFDAELPEHGDEATHLGLSDEQMASHMEIWMLEDPEEFDREFIDMMIHHHQGAIRMAYVEIEKGDDEDLKELAEHIVDAQSAEIKEMNHLREEWYGAPSPSGGVPKEGEEEKEAESGGH